MDRKRGNPIGLKREENKIIEAIDRGHTPDGYRESMNISLFDRIKHAQPAIAWQLWLMAGQWRSE